jgi:transposase/phage host-nuclease inhibitor protein Gam
MRGRSDDQLPLFHIFNVEDRIRVDHPLRDIKRRTDRILAGMSAQFAAAYSRTGRPSVPPERLLKALLLMALYSVRSERQLCERIDTDLLFRWFLDLQPSDAAFDATAFPHNRRRLDEHHLTQTFFAAVVSEALTADLCSEHFSVDGTLIQSYASAKSFQPIPAAGDAPAPDGNGFQPRNPEVDFHGQKRTNATHRSRTDPEAKLHRKGLGKEAKLSHMGHALGENRHGLILAVAATEANGTAERSAALDLLDELAATHAVRPATLGADMGYDDGQFFRDVESRQVEPHVPLIHAPRDPATAPAKDRAKVEARQRMKARMPGDGYRLSQKCRKKIEEGFGWLKTIAGLGRSRVVGRWKLQQLLEIGAAAYRSHMSSKGRIRPRWQAAIPCRIMTEHDFARALRSEHSFQEYHREVVQALTALGNPTFGKAVQQDRGSQLKHLGIRFPDLRRRVQQGFSFYKLPEAQVLEVWDTLWQTSPYGDVLFAALEFYAPIVRKRVDSGLWAVVRQWHKRVDNWCHSDALSALYSRMVPLAEISDPKNDFNLNLPRYIDSTEPEDLQDIDAHLNGGIPERDIDALEPYWKVIPGVRATLFEKADRPGYSQLKVAVADIKPAIFGHPEFSAFNQSANKLFTKWKSANTPHLKNLAKGGKPKALIETLSENLLDTFEKAPLLDPYDVYQHLMDYWAETMQDDVYMIVSDGWREAAKPRLIVQQKGTKTKDKPDFTVGNLKYKAELVPIALVIARYFAADQAAIEKLEGEVAAIEQSMEEMAEEHSGEEGLLEEGKNDRGNLTKASVRARLREIEDDAEAADERKVLGDYLALIEKGAATSAKVEDAQDALIAKVATQYGKLSEDEIKTLVVDDKWLATLATAVQGELERVSQRLTERIRELAERYAVPMPQLTEELATLAARVEGHLKKMGAVWK